MAAADETPSGGGDDEKVKYPLGFRFVPTLQELVEFYLLPKLLDKPIVLHDALIVADAYECDPEILTKRYEARGVDENWYFLSPRSRRYPGGDRPSRRTADNRGRWKPSTGQSKPGKDASKAKKGLKKNLSVGAYEFTENTLAYYVGDPRNETKTKWLMHELTVPDPEKEKDGLDSPTAEKPRDRSMLLNKYVMCRIYKSPLTKWKELESEDEGSTISASSACDEEVTTSSQSVPAPEGSGEASTPLTPLSSKCAGKRPAAEQPTSEQANAPNKRPAYQHTMRAPPVGVGAAGYYDYRSVAAQLPPLTQWPPETYSSMQGPVMMQRRPPLMNAHNGQPRVFRQYPPHRAAASVPNSLGRTVTMRPPNLAAGPPVRPQYFPRPPPPQQQQMETMRMLEQRVYAQLLAELKLQKAQQERASSAGQQQIVPAASTQPACFDDGANHPAGTRVMVPRTQFPAPHNFYPRSGVQQQLMQQSSGPAIPAACVPPPGHPAPAADDAPGNKLPMQGDANGGSRNEDSDYRKQSFADFAVPFAAAKKNF